MIVRYCINVLLCGNEAVAGSDYCAECQQARKRGEAVREFLKSDIQPQYIDQKAERVREYEHHKGKVTK